MLKLLKILLLITLIITLALVVVYQIYRDDLFKNAKNWFESELSKVIQHPVKIGSVEYVPFQSFLLKEITISPPEHPEKEAARIKNIAVALDVFSLLKNRKLIATVTLNSLYMENFTSSLTLRTESRSADLYKEVFDLSLLETIHIFAEKAIMEEVEFKKISGILHIENLAVSKGKVSLSYKDLEPTFDFVKLVAAEDGYHISVHSEDIDLSGIFSAEKDKLLIDKLTGDVYDFQVEMKGEIEKFTSPERKIILKGLLETDLEKISSRPGPLGSRIKALNAAGEIKSRVELSTNSKDIRSSKLEASFSSEEIKIKNITVNDISGKLSMKQGVLYVYLINGSLYGGALYADLSADLFKEKSSFVVNTKIADTEFGTLLRNITGKDTDVYGKFNLEMFLKGYALEPSTFTGKADISIYEANLGPMPILTPLLGNIYSIIQKILPGTQEIDITAAGANFDIKNRELVTDNLTLWGDEIFITATGYVDFGGNLDFTVQNHIRQAETLEGESWQVSLRNAVTSLGKLISRAHLRGTIEKPKWEFEYLDPIMDLITRNIRDFLGISE